MSFRFFTSTIFIAFAMLFPLFSNAQSKDLPDDASFDVLHYTINIQDINFEEKSLAGSTEMTAVALISNPASISLDFISLIVEDVQVNNENASFLQTDSTLVVFLPNGMQQGDEFVVKSSYSGTPFHESWGGVHFNGEYVFNLGVGISTVPHNLGRSWFPCVDSFSDKATFDYFITVPRDKVAVCGGLLQEVVHNESGTDTYHWSTDIQLDTYTASFAAGPYSLVEDVYHSEISGRDIPITYYVRPADTAKIATMFQNIHTIANLFETKFGPYEFERIGYLGAAIGAMEHQNNIAMPNSTITNDLSNEYLYAHELFHSWFGNLITCASAEDMWVNEGWATFAENYYQEVLYGRDTYVKALDDLRASVLLKAHKEDGGYFPLNQIPQSATYGISAYDRGCLVVQALRDYLTDDVFFPAVTQMIQNNKFSFMTSYEMCSELSKTSGVDLTNFFNNFVFQGGASAYVIDSCIVSPFGNEFAAEVFVQQKLYQRNSYTDANRVNICFMDENLNVVEHRMNFDSKSGNQTFIIDFEPVAVFVDYFHNSYDAKFDAEKMFKSTGQTTFKNTNFKVYVEEITDSVYCHVTHYLVAPNDTIIDGYRLSSTHHWKVDLVNFGEMTAKGMFNYAKSNYDSDLLDGTNSVVLLHREKPTMPWQKVETTQNGGNNVGDLIYDNIVSGEYTFAIIDSTHYGINNVINQSNINIYPNPSHGEYNINFGQKTDGGKLSIFNADGRLVENLDISAGESTIRWNASDKDTYYIFVMKFNDGTVETLKGLCVNK